MMKNQSILSLCIIYINTCSCIVSSFTSISTANPSLRIRVNLKNAFFSPNYIAASSRANIIESRRGEQPIHKRCCRQLPLEAIQNDSNEVINTDIIAESESINNVKAIKSDNMERSNSNNTNKKDTNNTNNTTNNDEPKIISKDSTDRKIDVNGLDLERDETMNFSEEGLGAYDPAKKLPLKREVIVGDPQLKVKKEEKSVAEILTELAAIQKQGPQKYCILGSRHVSYLHQQIIELLSYALVLSENHVYTSGAMGTNAAAIRGALRAGRPDLLTVILPQSLHKQTDESQELLRGVTDLIVMPQNDDMKLDVASRLCNSKLLSETDQLVAFAFHESTTIIEATKEAKKLEMLVTTLYLD